MNIHELNQGILLGLMAMAGVFIGLSLIGLILYAFELLLYKKEEKGIDTGRSKIEAEEGISKKVVAAIVSAIYAKQYIPASIPTRITISHKKKNSVYKKIKEKRWKNNG